MGKDVSLDRIETLECYIEQKLKHHIQLPAFLKRIVRPEEGSVNSESVGLVLFG